MNNRPYIIDQVLLDFLESDIAILVATNDKENQPAISRGFGTRVSDDCTQITVFVTERQSEKVINNAIISDQITINAARITNYESFQVKGNSVHLVELNRKDERHVAKYLEGVQLEMTKVGVTPEHAATIFNSTFNQKLLGIQFTAKEVFHQTPGPGAGKPRQPVE